MKKFQEEVLIRKVIYVTMQINYDVMKDRYPVTPKTGSQGFKMCLLKQQYQVS
jgi:hypothetical protein